MQFRLFEVTGIVAGICLFLCIGFMYILPSISIVSGIVGGILAMIIFLVDMQRSLDKK